MAVDGELYKSVDNNDSSEVSLTSQDSELFGSPQSEIVKEWLPFQKGAFNHSMGYMAKMFWVVLSSSLTLAPSVISRQLFNTSGLAFFNMIGETTNQAVFGIFGSIYGVFFVGLMMNLLDKYGIAISTAYGEKNYNGCKIAMTKGLLISTFYFCLITLPVNLYCRPFLKAINIEDHVCDLVQDTCWLALPLMTASLLSEHLKTFCMSQGHESIFGYTSAVNLFVTIAANYFVIVKYRWGVPGWILTRTISEIVSLIVGLYVLTKTNSDTRGLCTWKEVKEGFLSFYWDSTLFMLGVYPEILGFQVVAVCIARTGDTNQVAAYYCVTNIGGIIYNAGRSFANIARTRINILMGMKRYIVARNTFRFIVACNVIFGGFIALILLLLRNQLDSFYSSSNPKVEKWFLMLLLAFIIGCPSEISLVLTTLGLQSVGRISLLLILNIIITFFGSLAGCFIMSVLGYDSFYIFGYYMCISTILNITCLVWCLNSNWDMSIQEDNYHTKDIENAETRSSSPMLDSLL